MQQNKDQVLDENAENQESLIPFPYTVTFPDFEPSAGVTADIVRYMAKLTKFSDRIVSCHVSVRSPQKNKRTHKYQINVKVNVPGEQIAISREPGKETDHTNIHLAVRDAFKAVERQLRERHSRQVDHSGPQDPVAARIEAEGALDATTDILAANRVENLPANKTV